MPQEREQQPVEEQPAATEAGTEKKKEKDILDFDELLKSKEKKLKRRREVGQGGGE